MLVTLMWLVAIPLATCWLWRLVFARSLTHGLQLLESRVASSSLVMTDCVYGAPSGPAPAQPHQQRSKLRLAAQRSPWLAGSFLSAAVVFIILALTSLREHVQAIRGDELLPPRLPDVDAAAGADGGAAADADADGAGAGDPFAVPGGDDDGMPALDAADGLGGDEFGFEDLVGLRGPLWRLFENAATVLLSNAVFMALAAFIPLLAGRLVVATVPFSGLGLLHSVAASASAFASAALADPAHATAAALAAAASPATAAAAAAASLTAVTASTPPPQPAGANSSAAVAVEAGGDKLPAPGGTGRLASLATELEAQLAPPPLSDLVVLAAGYVVLAAFGALWVLLVCCWQCGLRAPLAAASAMAASAPALARQAAASARHAALLAKVGGLLVVELGIFPAGCGWWLDACTLRLFGATLPGRLAFAHGAPLTSTLVHWLVRPGLAPPPAPGSPPSRSLQPA